MSWRGSQQTLTWHDRQMQLAELCLGRTSRGRNLKQLFPRKHDREGREHQIPPFCFWKQSPQCYSPVSLWAWHRWGGTTTKSQQGWQGHPRPTVVTPVSQAGVTCLSAWLPSLQSHHWAVCKLSFASQNSQETSFKRFKKNRSRSLPRLIIPWS